MPTIQFIIDVKLPKRFTRREFNIIIREHSVTSHPNHYLQRLVERGTLKHLGKGIYQKA